MVARQITGPPELQQRPILVGRSRIVGIPVTVKGSRALIKVYSEVRVSADDPRVVYSIGLEPTIALVSGPVPSSNALLF